MADSKNSQPALPESQHQRWIKYGLNVVISSLVVIGLAVACIYITQTRKRRFDTTSSSINSLKPQTKNILADIKKPITLVSLYSRTIQNKSESKVDYAGQVEDLLDEYKRNSGGKIDVDFIDPVASPTKVDDLIHKVTDKYGGEVKKYKDFLDAYPKQYDQISGMATDESKKVAGLPLDQIKTQDLAETLIITISTVQSFPKTLETGKQKIDRQLKQKPPDYKGATDAIDQNMSEFSQMLARIIDDFKTGKDNDKVPADIRTYMGESLPRYEAMKKIADGLVDQIGKLGELKLDALRESLRARDSILVMGDTDLKVIPRERVWQESIDRKPSPGGDPVKPRFAGEQQVSTAILALTSATKPKVCFMRPGGPPVAEASPFSQGGASFAEVASRLRDYNFTVLEKDFTGMYAMQAQMQGQQAAPEPSDDEIKDAIWIVLNIPSQGQMGMPPPTIAAKLTEHLANGGSALVLNYPKADGLETALAPWGVKIDTDFITVKEKIPDTGGRQGDQVEQAERRYQHVFIIKDFGDSIVTNSLQSLEAALVPIVPIELTTKPGYTSSKIIPVPQTPASWATPISNFTTNTEVKYNSVTDKAPPIYAGAIVEKTSDKGGTNGGRLVVLGAFDFATDSLVTMPDEEMARQGYQDIPRFPGNAELFANSIYWLAHLEPMIAISPSAMQVSRIAPMSDTAARGWNIGVLLIGLPGLVVVAGIGMYLIRRD